MIKQDIHQFLGMQQDIKNPEVNSKYIYEGKNIRITSQGDNSLLHITNEKGNTQITELEFEGIYLGHCEIGDYIILFTTCKVSSSSTNIFGIDYYKKDYIYKLQFSNSNYVDYTILYEGDLGFKDSYPIQTLGICENESILKVYWTDGLNQPRVINILEEHPEKFTDNSFNFVQDVSLEEIIKVEKIESSNGNFPSGTVQYACTYYNKYGQESNIFYTSPLYYISPNDRGGNINEIINNSFKITFSNLDIRFDYVRVYSILRTSIDAQPTVKIIGDYNTALEHSIIKGNYENIQENTHYIIDNDNVCFNQQTLFMDNDCTEWLTDEGKEYAEQIIIYDNLGNEETLLAYLGNTTKKKHFEIPDIKVPSLIDGVEINKHPYAWLILENVTIKYNDYYIKNIKNLNIKSILYIGPSYKDYTIVNKGNSQGLWISTVVPSKSNLNSTNKKLSISETIETEIQVTHLEIIDNNNSGEIVDPTLLLYVGGEELIAGTMSQKDNVLFLGDLSIKRPTVELDLLIGTENNKDKLSSTYREIPIEIKEKGYYNYNSNLNKSNTAGFKAGEYYRLGVQFQYKNGRWSDPIFLGDYLTEESKKPKIENNVLSIPSINYILSQNDVYTIYKKGYKKVRPVVVFPTMTDRRILTQGMLCPTVYNIGNRLSNAPFAQSSWFIRPYLHTTYGLAETKNSNNNYIYNGANVEFRHNYGIFLNGDRGAEIQGIADFNSNINSNYSLKDLVQSNLTELAEKENFKASKEFSNFYMIDQSILTMHSPDIEWDSNIQASHNKDYKLQIVGLINFTASIGDINIQTSTSPINSYSSGFIHQTIGSLNKSNQASRSLVSGLFYKDNIVKYSDNDFTYDKKENETSWLIYPWHKSGSLNNDMKRPLDKGTRSAWLSKKVISNLKFSEFNTWLDYPFKIDNSKNYNGITPISVFNSNDISLTKIDSTSKYLDSNINYYGNVDTFIAPEKTQYYGNSESFESIIEPLQIEDSSKKYDELTYSKETVRIRYKSTPHIVFGLNHKDEEDSTIQYVLPSINSINKIDKTYPGVSDTKPSWIKLTEDTNSENTSSNESYTTIHYKSTNPPSDSNAEHNKIYCYHTDTADYIYKGYNVGSGQGESYWTMLTLTPGDIYKYENILYKVITVGVDDNGEYIYQLQFYTYYYNSTDSANDLITTQSKKFTIKQENYSLGKDLEYPYLFIAELYRENVENRFGGTTKEALKNNLWVPAGDAQLLDITQDNNIQFIYGDTWYQRYDCLKTYPFSNEDENQVVEIASFMCETRVNADGRYDKNRGQLSNLNVSPLNFNLWNPVYSQKDNFFKYRILDIDFYKLNKFPNTITWTKEKQMASNIDIWTNLTMASTLDLDGNKGKVTSLNTWNNEIYCFQESAISNILFNTREQIATTSGVPIEISNGMKVSGKRYISESIGCSNKWSIVNSSNGLYFIDRDSKDIYLFNGKLMSLTSSLNLSDYIKTLDTTLSWEPIIIHNRDKTVSINFNGIKGNYDKANKRILFINDNITLCFSETLSQFESILEYPNTYTIFNMGHNTYTLHTPTVNNSNNIVYPKMYTELWQNNTLNTTNIYGENKESYVTVVSNQSPLNDKIFNTIEFRGTAYNEENIEECPFNKIRVWNDYQDTGEVELNNKKNLPSNLKRKFRIWRANIPRNNGTRDRIRNPWTYVKLSNTNSKKFELFDLDVQYFV